MAFLFVPHAGKDRGVYDRPIERPTHMSNPRYQNGNKRRIYRARFKAMNNECGICKGRLGPIHYNEPSNAEHPLSFVIDEIKPVSRYREFGYESKRAAAEDWNNLQAAHYICNARKSNKTMFELGGTKNKSRDLVSADW